MQLRLLLVEDSEDDAALLSRELARGGYELEARRVCTEETLHAALTESWDLAISDFSMPNFTGLRAFEIMRVEVPELPVIFVSGVLGEERAVEAMRLGARDYFVKGKTSRLGVAVARELREAKNRQQRVAAELALATEERRYRSIFESASVGIIEMDLSSIAIGQPRVVAANRAAKAMFEVGTTHELGVFVAGFAASSVWRDVVECAARGLPFHREVELAISAKRTAHLLISATLPSDPTHLHSVVFCVIDLAERRRLELEVQAAQRMDSIGRLAGGIAHDFNNIVSVITSYANFVNDALPERAPAREDVAAIQDAAGRAAALTHQLLAFGRRQPQRERVLDLNVTIRGFERLLRVAAEDVRLTLALGRDLHHVRMDPSQLEQVLMNLTVNARHAMPSGGTLTIETRNGIASATDDEPGSYVALEVRDTGIGMDEATRLQVFDPFFTTKPTGQGTGLGLSTVYGIVKQSGGSIAVRSVVGSGTTFEIRLPRSTDRPDETTTARHVKRPATGVETILLVEDEAAVRTAIRRILEGRGYTVLEAANGREASLVGSQHPGPIALLLTDIVMPELDGISLAKLVREQRPATRILFMSGYAVGAHDMQPDASYLSKPFTRDELAQRVRDVLDART